METFFDAIFTFLTSPFNQYDNFTGERYWILTLVNAVIVVVVLVVVAGWLYCRFIGHLAKSNG